MKRLLFSLPYGIGFRNVVCCGVLEAAIRHGTECTVLLPHLSEHDRARIMSQLPPNVQTRELKTVKHSAWFTVLKLAKQHFYARRTGLDSFRVKRNRRRSQSRFLHAGASALEMLAEHACSEEWVDEQIGLAKQPFERYYRDLLEELQVDVVILAKPGYQPEDLPLIKSARARRTPTVSIDTTWDNIVSKRPTYLAPDALSAWSSRMREEAIAFYRLRPERVSVTGGAAFDVFGGRQPLPSREVFLSTLGLDPARQLVVFTLNNPSFNPQNPEYVRFLLEAVRTGDIAGKPNVVVRMHPWDRDSNHETIVHRYDRAYIERPFGVPDPRSVYECIPSQEEVIHYGALMTHADVVVNIGSTTSLDAIAADTPVVNIAFDISETDPALSAARFYDYSHYKPIVDSGAVRLTWDRSQFFREVNAFLENPSIDADKRSVARRDFLTYTDGCSASRVAQAIVGLC